MNEHDMKIGQINAVIYAAEEVINRVKDVGTILMAKETAYDHIKQIMAGKVPWQEEEQKVGGE